MTENEKLADIKNHPENHRHNFDELTTCCMVRGALSLMLMEAHERFTKPRGDGYPRCDVRSGPCSCGGWH